MAQRPGEVAEQALTECRVAGRVEREALLVHGECGLELGEPPPGFDDARQVAGLVLEDPSLLRSARQAPPAPPDGHGAARAPHRRDAAWGTACRDSRARPGRMPCAGASWRRGRPR